MGRIGGPRDSSTSQAVEIAGGQGELSLEWD